MQEQQQRVLLKQNTTPNHSRKWLIVTATAIALLAVVFSVKELTNNTTDTDEILDQAKSFYKNEEYFEAIKLFQQIDSNAEAQYYLGCCYSKGQGTPQDYYEAVKWYRKSAKQVLTFSQYALVLCVKNGYAVTQDPYVAEFAWKISARGWISGQYYLGMCYEYGYGVSQNYSDAAKWYRTAAEQGNAGVQTALGMCY